MYLWLLLSAKLWEQLLEFMIDFFCPQLFTEESFSVEIGYQRNLILNRIRIQSSNQLSYLFFYCFMSVHDNHEKKAHQCKKATKCIDLLIVFVVVVVVNVVSTIFNSYIVYRRSTKYKTFLLLINYCPYILTYLHV